MYSQQRCACHQANPHKEIYVPWQLHTRYRVITYQADDGLDKKESD